MKSETKNFPEELIKSIEHVCEINIHDFIDAHNQPSVTSVRYNPFKKDNQLISGEKITWATDAFRLNERIEFIKDPFFHAGCYYVQEASSMFLEEVMRQHISLDKQLKVLDLCASPGGKSTLINSLINDESILVSNEVIKSRVPALLENMTKWGTCNHVVTSNDPVDFKKLPNYFDVIVVDAPCSGSGLFRKQPDIISKWNNDLVRHCKLRQERILADILFSLKPGGFLIYATCSFSTEENEEIVEYLIQQYEMIGLPVMLNPVWNICETITNSGGKGYRFFPHLTNSEGFFISILQKGSSEDWQSGHKTKKALKKKELKSTELNTVSRYLQNETQTEILLENNQYFILNKYLLDELAILSRLNIHKKGTLAGIFKSDDFIPDHEFGLSKYLNNDLNSINLNLNESLLYLKKMEIKLQHKIPLGFCRVNFNGYSLGWAKNIGNRINNYLPKEWRILKHFQIEAF
jgi:16S rRNA C967 or C1407 C5-methylase (RsmB/RsmF family)/NOL1/NOP2/fmu family ribosome biogenesis protein